MTESRALRRFTDAAIGRATNTSKHSGEGWAERHLEATNFGLPVERDQRSTARRTQDDDISREHLGATYKMVTHEQTQSGDALKPHGVPPGYERPMSVLDLIVAGAPRVLRVSQNIRHGPERRRAEAFEAAAQEAADVGAWSYAVGYFDRRYEGRRHRAGSPNDGESNRPYERGGWQADVPFERYLGY